MSSLCFDPCKCQLFKKIVFVYEREREANVPSNRLMLQLCLVRQTAFAAGRTTLGRPASPPPNARRPSLRLALALAERARAPVLGLRHARAAARPEAVPAVHAVRRRQVRRLLSLLRHGVLQEKLEAAQEVALGEGRRY